MPHLFSTRFKCDTPFGWQINSDSYAIYQASLISLLLHGLLFLFADMLSVHQVSPGKAYPKSEAGPLVVTFKAHDNSQRQESAMADKKIAESISPHTSHEVSALPSGTTAMPPTKQKRNSAGMSADQDQHETPLAPPEFTVGIEPHFPLLLFSKGIKGVVTASFNINRAGEIREIEIIASQPLGAFDESVLQAIMAARVRVDQPFPRGRVQLTVVFDPAGTGTQIQIGPQKYNSPSASQ